MSPQRLNAAANNAVDLAFGWDPTEPVATRPLWMQRPAGSYNFFYFHDGNKNVSELVSYQSARGVPAHYEYAPFGAVVAATTNTAFTAFNVAETNPFRFSSDYADDALGLVYYSYRHYEPMMGRWLSRDLMEEHGGVNLFGYLFNSSLSTYDRKGLKGYADYNFKDCTLEVSLTYRVVFIPGAVHTWYDEHWNPDYPKRKEWKDRAKSLAEKYFNGGFAAEGETHGKWKMNNRCMQKCPKKCTDGVTVKFTLNLMDDGDFTKLMVWGDRMTWDRRNENKDGGLMILYVGCMSNTTTYYDNKCYVQIQLIHEIGHALGLDHPGQDGVLGKAEPNSFDDYTEDPDSLMGLWMKLSEDDFNKAFCSHIPEDK